MNKLAWKLHFPQKAMGAERNFPVKIETILAEKWTEIKKNVNFPWPKPLAKRGTFKNRPIWNKNRSAWWKQSPPVLDLNWVSPFSMISNPWIWGSSWSQAEQREKGVWWVRKGNKSWNIQNVETICMQNDGMNPAPTLHKPPVLTNLTCGMCYHKCNSADQKLQKTGSEGSTLFSCTTSTMSRVPPELILRDSWPSWAPNQTPRCWRQVVNCQLPSTLCLAAETCEREEEPLPSPHSPWKI